MSILSNMLSILLSATVAAAIVAGLAAVVGGIVTGAINAHNANKVNESSQSFSEQSATTAFNRQKELLDYNSPAYQMQRFTDAGLNPNLVYSQGVDPIPNVNSADTPSLKTPTIPDFSGVSGDGMDAALKAAQINRLNVASDNESDLTDAQVKSLFKGLNVSDAQIQLFNANSQLLSEQLPLIKSKISNIDAHTRSTMLDVALKEYTLPFDQKQALLECGMTEIQAKYYERFVVASILNDESSAKHYLSQANLNYKQQLVAENLASYYKELSTGQGYENTITQQASSVLGSRLSSGLTVGQDLTIHNAVARKSILLKQAQLLNRFGDDEHMAKLILTYSQVWENATGGINNLFGDASDYLKSSSSKKKK